MVEAVRDKVKDFGERRCGPGGRADRSRGRGSFWFYRIYRPFVDGLQALGDLIWFERARRCKPANHMPRGWALQRFEHTLELGLERRRPVEIEKEGRIRAGQGGSGRTRVDV